MKFRIIESGAILEADSYIVNHRDIKCKGVSCYEDYCPFFGWKKGKEMINIKKYIGSELEEIN